jgi:2-oxoglutarate dehydrogenase E1 component
VIKAPIFHVNGDDVEALIHTVIMAMEYRQTFYSDVFIDILSYRKYGHNEGDEPRYTQPTLYKAIAPSNPRIFILNPDLAGCVYSGGSLKQQRDLMDSQKKSFLFPDLGKVHIQRFSTTCE